LDTSVTTEVQEGTAAPPAEIGLSARPEGGAWDFAHFLSTHLASLETRAAILVPAQVAALIALWTQLYTFEETLPRTLVWIAWSVLIVALAGAAWLITPGRVHRRSIVHYGLQARPGADGEEIAREVCEMVQERVRVLHVGLRASIGLTLLALGLLVLAYALDEALFNG
jgi:hypothetical protein